MSINVKSLPPDWNGSKLIGPCVRRAKNVRAGYKIQNLIVDVYSGERRLCSFFFLRRFGYEGQPEIHTARSRTFYERPRSGFPSSKRDWISRTPNWHLRSDSSRPASRGSRGGAYRRQRLPSLRRVRRVRTISTAQERTLHLPRRISRGRVDCAWRLTSVGTTCRRICT